MTWEDALKIITAAIVSVGGAGVIICAVSKFLADRVAERLDKKYEAKLAKDQAKVEAQLSKKEYISKTRFDAEFKIFQELSEAQITLVNKANEALGVINGTYKDDADKRKKFLEEFKSNYWEFDTLLKKYAPFVSEKIYDQYKDLFSQITSVYNLSFIIIVTVKNWDADVRFTLENKEFTLKNVQEIVPDLGKKLREQSDHLTKEIRSYLDNLDAIQ